MSGHGTSSRMLGLSEFVMGVWLVKCVSRLHPEGMLHPWSRFVAEMNREAGRYVVCVDVCALLVRRLSIHTHAGVMTELD